MDHTGALRSFPAFMECPGTAFVRTGSQECLQVQQFVCGLDQTGNTGFFQADFLKEHLALFICLEFGDFAFDLGCNDQDFRILVFDGFADGFHIFIAVHGAGFVDVADIHDRFVGQQEQVVCNFLFVFRLKRNSAGTFSLLQCFFVFAKYFVSDFCLFVTACLCLFLHFGDTAVDGFQVLDLQLGIDNLLIADRVYTPVYVDDVIVVEAAQYMQDCIRFTDIGKELVAQAFPFAGSFNETGDIYDFHRCGNHALGVFDLSQFIQSFVRYGDNADIRFYRTKREVCRLCFCIR